MLRAIVLSLALLIGIGTLIPLATEFAEAGSQKQRKYKKKKVKKYSKRWWRAYNKRKAIKRAKLRRARSAKLRRARLAKVRRARGIRQNRTVAKTKSMPRVRTNSDFRTVESSDKTVMISSPTVPTVLPSGNPAPKTWKPEGFAKGELQFRVTDNNGSPIGAAAISVVGPAMEDNQMYNNRAKTVGGVTTTALRRKVIDQMIKENGWVVNDFQKEVGGKKVYVVVAQAPDTNNQVENRTFYFTEVEGQIYSVATKSPDNSMERIEEESEKVINSLQRKAPTTQLASNRTASNLVANEE